MDIEQIYAVSPVLGQEFLTWLWCVSEKSGGRFLTPQSDEFFLYFEHRISVVGGEGEFKESAVSSGAMSELKEARSGLKSGKKVMQARVRVESGSGAWQVQLSAEDFGMTGLKTPKVDKEMDEDEDPDSRVLEKIYLFEKLLEIIDFLYARFVDIRFSPQWADEQRKVMEWIAETS